MYLEGEIFYEVKNGEEASLEQTVVRNLVATIMLKKISITYVFCRPYSSWQRGSNENSNGLLRGFYPKGYDLIDVVEYNLMLINNRPRKCLAWKSAFDRFFYECCT